MMRFVRLASALAVGAFVILLTVYRSHQLATGRAFTAVGEKKWGEWAYRWGMAEPLRDARRQLQPGEKVDLIAHHPVFEEGWWRVMARYYLPENPVEKIQRAADPIAPGHNTLVVVHEKSVEVIRGR